nr:restriction endonuclease subunit S [uncultured Lachnoanaerobaculum sp.]
MSRVPRIRFKGFEEDWEQRKLGEIAERIVRKNEKLESTLPLTISAQYGLIDQNEFFDKRIASKDVRGYYLIKKGEFAYNKSTSVDAPFGAIKRLDKYKNGVLSTLYILFKVIDDTSTCSDYLVTYYFTDLWHKGIQSIAAEGARNHGLLNIAPNDFFETMLSIPLNVSEQKKVGGFFISLDHLITLHQRKLEKLKIIKKSMLENLFPQNGEKTPKIRFSGFTKDWEQRKLGEIVGIYDGVHQTPKYQDNGIMFLSVENIATLQSTKYISEDNFKRDYKVYPQENDILMTRIGDVGTTNVIADKGLKAYYVSLALLKYKSTNPYFLSNAIQSEYVKKELANRTLKTAIPMKINKDEIGKVDVMLPISVQEQNKIGEYFRNIDHLITLHQSKLEKLQKIKKSMLECMFI